MKNTRITKTIIAFVITTMLVTGCSTKAPTVTTETVDVTTYMVIDENEPTVTETVKNDDGTTTIITKTTDGSTVSIATTTTEATTTETEKETEVTTTKATPTETTKATATPTTEVKPTEPTATPTETTKPTDTPKPTETTKPTDAPKPTTKPSEPTTKPTEPTTKPTTPEPKPTTPEPTETTPKPTTPEPTTPEPVKYEVRIKGNTGGTGTGAGYYKAGETVTITATADSGYHFDYWNNITESTKATTATYTFTMPEKTLVFKPYFEQDATTPEPTKYYYAELDIQFKVSFTDANGTWHENEYLPITTVTVYDPNGNVSLKSKIYGYANTEAFMEQYLNSLYPNATISGWSHTQSNLRNLRETL